MQNVDQEQVVRDSEHPQQASVDRETFWLMM